MSSPRIEVFFVYDAVTGVPLTGATPSFNIYKNDQGTNVSQPSISEIGSTGIYKFTPVFSDAARGIAYIISTAPNGTPLYVARYMRPEDWNDDLIPLISGSVDQIKKVEFGRWKIHTSGGDSGNLVLYNDDGVTPMFRFQLNDSSGSPSVNSPFERVPV